MSQLNQDRDNSELYAAVTQTQIVPPAGGSSSSFASALESFLEAYGRARSGAFTTSGPVGQAMEKLRQWLQGCEQIIGRPYIKVKLSVGQGGWTKTPWIALLDERITTSTQRGIYIVFLVAEDLSVTYLTLNQGMTELVSRLGQKGAVEEMLRVSAASRPTIAEIVSNSYALDNIIDLRSDTTAARNYELGTIAHLSLATNDLPSDAEITKQLATLLEAYDELVTASEGGETSPSEPADEEGSQEPAVAADPYAKRMPSPTNLILYGPPGTGKTFATAAVAVQLCGDPVSSDDRSRVMEAYSRLCKAGRIEFVTFHQSLSYEDFVEGLRPVTETLGDNENAGNGAGFKLQPYDGIFKQIVDVAANNRGKAVATDLPLIDRNRKIFKMSLGRSWASEDDAIYQDAIRDGYVVLGWGGDVDWSAPRYDEWEAIKERWRQDQPKANGNDPNMSQMYAFRINMQIGSLVVISDGNRKFRAIGEIRGPYCFVPGPNGEYNHRRSVRWLWHSDESLPRELIYSKELSQVSAYQMNSRFVNWDSLEQIVASGGDAGATTGTPEPHVLIIDEINRANISKVFGELITLIEPDKRLGMPNALTVKLPYSKTEFGVPANLHIIGTMNTADRSIALLDTALRRRFEFRELMPKPSVLEDAAQETGVDLPKLLTVINERIEFLFDREHQIGHAYFIHCKSPTDVDAVMRHKVIPLLAEYFYEDWHKIAVVLGDAETHERVIAGGFLNRAVLKAPSGLEGDGEAATRFRWSVRSEQESFDYSRLLGA